MSISKSEQIRQLLNEQPDLTPSEIQTALAVRGIEVSRNLCKVVRHREQQSAAKDEPTAERKLRRGETRLGRKVYRLSKEDLAIRRFIERYAKRIPDPSMEFDRYDGMLIRMHERVCQWLDAVSTRNAKRRRKEILDFFIDDLRRLYTKPEKAKRASRPTIRKIQPKSNSGTRRKLTEEERKQRMERYQ